MEDEDGLYSPTSSFLIDVMNGIVPLSGNEFADSNLHFLLEMTHDPDRANRDWAVFILSQAPVNSAEICAILLDVAKDLDPRVSAEAIAGLARRDRHTALPLVAKALSSQTVAINIFEAAAYCAHESLIEALQRFVKPNDESYENAVVIDALKACESGNPPEL